MSDFFKHPGYLGLTSQGVIAIHADWPIYPEEHGSDLALIWLTSLPSNTKFKMIDEIITIEGIHPTRNKKFRILNFLLWNKLWDAKYSQFACVIKPLGKERL